VVCANCSSKKFLLPSQSTKALRVCDGCYSILTTTSGSVDQKMTGNQIPTSPSIVKSSKSSKLSVFLSNNNQPLIPKDSPHTDLDEVANEVKQIEQKEFVDFNNKHLSIIREESIDECTTPKTPPTTPVAKYPKPLPLHPTVSIEIGVEPRPPVQKMFSVDIVDDEQLKMTLMKMPKAPMEEPEIEIKPRNPQLYQLCQMNSTSSFWWDNSEDESNDDFGLNFRSDGVPITSSSANFLSPAHPQLTASESITSYNFEEKGKNLSAPFEACGGVVFSQNMKRHRI
jgi:hypothetical protein